MIYPGHLVIFPSSNVSFTCVPSDNDHRITSIEWLLNGMTQSTNLSNVRILFSMAVNGVGVLKFINTPLEYNGTTVQCVADLDPPRSRQDSSSTVATLLIQGRKDCPV